MQSNCREIERPARPDRTTTERSIASEQSRQWRRNGCKWHGDEAIKAEKQREKFFEIFDVLIPDFRSIFLT